MNIRKADIDQWRATLCFKIQFNFEHPVYTWRILENIVKFTGPSNHIVNVTFWYSERAVADNPKCNGAK